MKSSIRSPSPIAARACAAKEAASSASPRSSARYARKTAIVAGTFASLLVNVPATIAVFRAYLAELRGDAEDAASFAAQALAAIGEGERMLDFITQGHLAIAEWLGGRLAESEQ